MFLKKRKDLLLLEEVKGDQSTPRMQALLHSTRHLILKLSESINAKFEIINQQLIADINGVRCYIECEEDLFIVNEVFNEYVYGFHGNGDFVLIDIGLNIGISSLFFNQMPQISKIYAFEPVTETFEKCLKNLALNNGVEKIVPFNYGLGNEDRKDQFIYSDSFKGSVGRIGLSDYKKNNSAELKTVAVEIKEASRVIDDIVLAHPNQKIIIKMDCEGGEYEIIPNLKQTGTLNNIDILMMEWHGNDFLKIWNGFENFHSFYSKNSPTTGMLFAASTNQ